MSNTSQNPPAPRSPAARPPVSSPAPSPTTETTTPVKQKAPQPAPAAPQPPPAPRKPFEERVPENIAGMLSYPLGWIGGLILMVIDKRPFVRYHAAQSVVVFAGLSLLLLILGDFFLAGFVPGEAILWSILRRMVELTWIVAAVVLMLKAYSGERYRVPLAAAYADRAARTKE
jgi:uncharacterized membrane protein